MSATEMQAGRELDALIAERVFGWEWRRGWTPKGHTPLKALFKPGEHYDSTPLQGDEGTWSKALDEVPPYSADIAAAFLVVAKATDYQFASVDFDLQTGAVTRHRADLWFGKRGHCSFGKGVADTLPHAICLAALAARESDSRPPRPTGGEE